MVEPPREAGRTTIDPVTALRVLGSVAVIGGLVLATIELARHPMNPTLPWLAVFLVTVLTGVGLRIEAAIRERR